MPRLHLQVPRKVATYSTALPPLLAAAARASAGALAATSMGKKSRRDRAGNRDPTMHPSQGLQKATRRHHPDADIGDTFLPLTEIPASLESSADRHDRVQIWGRGYNYQGRSDFGFLAIKVAPSDLPAPKRPEAANRQTAKAL